VKRGEDKLFGNFCCVKVRSGGRLDLGREAYCKLCGGGKLGKSLTAWGWGIIVQLARTGDELRARKAVPVFEVY
jgi:hypothetical protein